MNIRWNKAHTDAGAPVHGGKTGQAQVLKQLAFGSRHTRSLAETFQGGQANGCQYADDRDDHQQFDQGKRGESPPTHDGLFVFCSIFHRATTPKREVDRRSRIANSRSGHGVNITATLRPNRSADFSPLTAEAE